MLVVRIHGRSAGRSGFVSIGECVPRAHVRVPFWDALKGQVQDSVEILTSVDGSRFPVRACCRPRCERRTSRSTTCCRTTKQPRGGISSRRWRPRRRPACAITSRQSAILSSELQVFDRIDYQPFDLRIALPGDRRRRRTGRRRSSSRARRTTRSSSSRRRSPDRQCAGYGRDRRARRILRGCQSIGIVTAPPYQVTMAERFCRSAHADGRRSRRRRRIRGLFADHRE